MLSLQPLPVAQGGCWSAGHQHQLSPPRTLLVCRSSKQPRRDDTLRSLDALLPTAPPPVDAATPPPPPPQSESGDGYAWFDRPASAQTNPLRTRGMEAGASGRYLDAEKLTRDPLELSVGQRTAAADGGPLSLPEARPLASRALAIATLVAGCGSLSGLLPPLLMSSTEVALGAHWQLLTASLQPLGWANLAATVAALATAGAYAERRMGSTRFAATYLAGGAMTSLAYYAASAVLEEGTGMAGAAAALLGPAAALAVFAAANWRVLGAAQRGHCALAAAGLAAVALTELELLAPVYAVSAVAGAALGAAAGPQLQILRELDIKEGSMTISGNEDELVVVVDRRTAPQRLLFCGAAGLLLAGATWLADGAVSLALEDDFLNVLLSNWSDPEVQLELFNRAPESWDLRA